MYKVVIFSTALGALREQLESFCHGCQEMHNLLPSGLFGRHRMFSTKTYCIPVRRIEMNYRSSKQEAQYRPSNTLSNDFPHRNLRLSDSTSNHHLLLTSNEVACTGMRLNLNTPINSDMKKKFESPKVLKNRHFIEKLLCYWVQKEYKAVLGSSLSIRAIWAFLDNRIKSKPNKLLSHF